MKNTVYDLVFLFVINRGFYLTGEITDNVSTYFSIIQEKLYLL